MFAEFKLGQPLSPIGTDKHIFQGKKKSGKICGFWWYSCKQDIIKYCSKITRPSTPQRQFPLACLRSVPNIRCLLWHSFLSCMNFALMLLPASVAVHTCTSVLMYCVYKHVRQEHICTALEIPNRTKLHMTCTSKKTDQNKGDVLSPLLPV